MPPGAFDVFLSHNREDKPAVVELAQALRGRGLNVWLDLWELVPGRPWQEALEEIIATVGAAAVCLGPSGLGPWEKAEMRACLSELVDRGLPVIPVILPAAPTPEIPELPLFLRNVTWVDLRPAVTEEGLGRLVWGITGVKPEASPPPLPRRTVSPRPRAEEPAERFELAVEIERSGGGLAARFVLPGGAVRERRPVAWSAVQEEWNALRQRLDEAGPVSLSRWLADARQGRDTLLFRLLFGEEAEWRPVLCALFGAPDKGPQPNPVKHPVRLRVATSDPDLSGFPWRLTAWEGRRLVHHGWTFEVGRDALPARTVALPAPAPVLVFDPTGGGGLLREVEGVLAAVWRQAGPESLRPAASLDELERALAGMQPRLLLLRGAVETLPLSDLPGIFRRAHHVPDAVVVEAAGLGHLPEELLGSEVPLLLSTRLPEAPRDSAWLLPWLRRFLERGEDPLATLHAVVAEGALAENPVAATLAVRTAYRSWSTAPPPQAPGPWNPRHELDRVQVKSEVVRRLTHLTQRDGQRALGLVATAAPDHAVSSLCRQLRADLERETDPSRLPIQWYRPEFPGDRDRSRLRTNLEAELALHLGADDREPLPHLLRRMAPKGAPGGTRGTLWLDWGTFGKSPGCRPPLTAEELRTWLLFSGELLARQCPPDLRIVTYLAIESDKLDRVNELLHELQDEPICQAPEFSLIPLDPLKEVTAHDLREFLREPRYGCPPALRGDLARLIHAQTGGKFDPTVALLERAKETSWYALLDFLKQVQGVVVPDRGEEL